MRTLRRALALPSRDRWIAAQATLMLPVVALGLRFMGITRIQTLLSRSMRNRGGDGDVARARQIGGLVNAVARRGPYRANCLKRTLVAWWLLGRRGTEAQVRFGVRPGSPPAFHAWLEVDGEVVNDRQDVAEIYLPFSRPIGPENLRRFD